MKNIAIVLAMVSVLSACSATTQTVYKYAPRPIPVEPQTLPVQMRKVEWKVLTKNELITLLADLEKNPDPNFALFALTPKGFENLSSNLIEINRFMQEQNEVIQYYRVYIRDTSAVPAQPNAKKK